MFRGVSPAEYDLTTRNAPHLCPLFLMGDKRTGRELVRHRVDLRTRPLLVWCRRRCVQPLNALRETKSVLDLGLSRVEGWSVRHCPLSRV